MKCFCCFILERKSSLVMINTDIKEVHEKPNIRWVSAFTLYKLVRGMELFIKLNYIVCFFNSNKRLRRDNLMCTLPFKENIRNCLLFLFYLLRESMSYFFLHVFTRPVIWGFGLRRRRLQYFQVKLVN